MSTTYGDYMKERESFETGPLVFTWFESNPEEPPDCRLCYRSGTGYYISGIDGGFEWSRPEGEPSEQLLIVSDRRGAILVITGKDRERAVEVMQRLREAACSAVKTDGHGPVRAATEGTDTDGHQEEATMSRHTFGGHRRGLRIVASWDNPLETYFAQVWEGDPADGELRLWVGAGRDRVLSVEALARLLSPYGTIPSRVAVRLEGDREERTEPTPLQRLLAK